MQGRPSTDDIAVRPTPPEPRAGEGQPNEIRLDDPPPPTDVLPGADAGTAVETDLPLLDDDEADGFLDRWREVQTRFVDDPQAAVRDGDSLVAELMQALARRFAEHKAGLEEQWQRGGEPETEDLRQALQSYRSFFQRLLST